MAHSVGAMREESKTKVELRGIKYYPALSEETECFSAKVVIDGKVAGTVANGGTGGPDDFSSLELIARLDAIAIAQLPPLEADGIMLKPDAEILVGKLLSKELDRRYLRRVCAKQTLFRLKSDPEDTHRTVKAKFSPEVKAFITKKYGDQVSEILNEKIGRFTSAIA